MTSSPAQEQHLITRIGWLRAAVLGANDGILSTASVIVGVAAAKPGAHTILLAGIAALTAGAMSMAAGEYVSVSSQADTEAADLAREAEEQRVDPRGEARELAAIYIKRGLSSTLAKEVAAALMAKDALGAHARDELGITEVSAANPVQAALASAASFVSGGICPVLTVLLAPASTLLYAVVAVALVLLAVLGGAGAKTGGAKLAPAVIRVVFWGALAMAVTAGVGRLFGVAAG
ncbi:MULTISPECIES: VIT1/CCC1 transporter family protein [Sphingosinicellaceae]|uniref:VIT1/CCC1 transporter family protein n=1 Tax=Sphingosinicellaceae TaxID=2820280 RepID=UPI001C1DF08E|nr:MULTISPECIES: VIT family protein [Polymorphobacter]QYE33085.1 VIT family protein [Polymorphobacter sp. PAMC 29334]UAJ12325.1 VIT family protein [Polymorphobacter megasporae]